MKIMHVYKDYFPVPGGIENHVKTLAEAQALSGHDVMVLVTNPSGLLPDETINGVHVVRARRLATIASTPLSVDLIYKLTSAKADVTHLHFPYPIGEVGQLIAGHRRPYVITYHSDVVRQQRLLALYHPLLMRVLRRSRRIIATSARYVESSRYLSWFKEKCTVVPLSVDAKTFSEATALLPRAGRPVILFVGQHRHYKGVDDLLRALAFVDADLLIGGDGPMRPAWERLSSELNLGDRVRFLGHVPDDALPGLYASADVFVLSANSRAEAFGKVLLEAMAAGLPCITTELGTGTSYVVQHEVTGLVVPPRNPMALAGAMERLLKDEALRQRMGVRGQERVARKFSPQRMTQSVEAVYRDALQA